MAHLTFFCFSKILLSIPVVVHILIPYRLLLLHSQSLSHSFIYFIPRHSPFTCQWTFIVLHAPCLLRNDTQPLRVFFSVRWPWRALSERWTAGHPPFRICHWIVLIPTSSLMTFPGEASHTYFFRRKVSASRILQVPDALFPEFFQKLFAVCRASNKNFSWPKGEIIR